MNTWQWMIEVIIPCESCDRPIVNKRKWNMMPSEQQVKKAKAKFMGYSHFSWAYPVFLIFKKFRLKCKIYCLLFKVYLIMVFLSTFVICYGKISKFLKFSSNFFKLKKNSNKSWLKCFNWINIKLRGLKWTNAKLEDYNKFCWNINNKFYILT